MSQMPRRLDEQNWYLQLAPFVRTQTKKSRRRLARAWLRRLSNGLSSPKARSIPHSTSDYSGAVAMSCNFVIQSPENKFLHWRQSKEEEGGTTRSCNVMLTSCKLRSEKSVNLEEVLSIKLPLKYPLSIFVIAHYKSPDGAINDLSVPV